MRVQVSPTILVEETFMTFFALMCNFMETVYRSLHNRLRIHQVFGHGFGWTPRLGDGQGGRVCCGSWCRKESDTTDKLN